MFGRSISSPGTCRGLEDRSPHFSQFFDYYNLNLGQHLAKNLNRTLSARIHALRSLYCWELHPFESLRIFFPSFPEARSSGQPARERRSIDVFAWIRDVEINVKERARGKPEEYLRDFHCFLRSSLRFRLDLETVIYERRDTLMNGRRRVDVDIYIDWAGDGLINTESSCEGGIETHHRKDVPRCSPPSIHHWLQLSISSQVHLPFPLQSGSPNLAWAHSQLPEFLEAWSYPAWWYLLQLRWLLSLHRAIDIRRESSSRIRRLTEQRELLEWYYLEKSERKDLVNSASECGWREWPLTLRPDVIVFEHDHRTEIVSMLVDSSDEHAVFLDESETCAGWTT